MKRNLHLFLMLFLLIAGIAEVSAGTVTYTVNYVGRTTSQGAGFTVSSANNYSSRISSYSPTQIITTRNGNNYYTITSSDYGQYFTVNPIDGYSYSVAVTTNNSGNNRTGTITITYTSLSKTYRMIFDRQMVPGSGYTVKDAYKGNGTNGLKITSADDAEFLVFEATTANGLPDVTTDNISTYITARTVSGYSAPSFYVNTAEAELGYSANVTINYVTTADPTDPSLTWNDGTYQYSRIYTRQSYNTVLLPEDEVAISLYLGETAEVTDTVAYATSQEIQYLNTNYNVVNNNGVVIGTIRVTGSSSNYTYNFTPASGTFADDDGDGVGTTATYEYLGHHANGFGTDATLFFKRTHQVACSTLTNAVIPATTVHNGVTYKVTAIQKWGFCYSQTDQMMIDNGTPDACTEDYFWGCIDDHSNWYLRTVSFEYPSNIKSVGDYAFMSCVKLKSAIFPSSIEYLGQGIFEMCEALTNMQFQTVTANDLKTGESEDLIGKVRFNAIRMFTFWLCCSLETLELPDGITMIEGQQAGAALQYMLSLINLRLPNTLESIGPHFLCCATKLKTLTIPASVKYIDGASFHGCESLENVYLLGPAAALQLEYTASGSTSGSSTFSANETFCADEVAGCTFWTTEDYLQSYKDDPVWKLVDTDGNPNWLKPILEERREFEPGKWATAIFPHQVPDACAATNAYDDENVYDRQEQVKNGFGANTKVAVMESAEAKDATDPNTGEPITVYDITFRLLIPTDGKVIIPADTPVLICPGETCKHLMCTNEDMEDEAFKARMSIDYKSTITPQGGKFNSTIDMQGRYTPHQLMPWDFYFMYSGETAKFYRVPNQTNAAKIKAFRCWWTLKLNGARVDGQAVNSQGAKFFKDFEDDNATAIQTVDGKNIIVKAGIYDVQGRKLNVSEEELPQGMFIINGKKVIIK